MLFNDRTVDLTCDRSSNCGGYACIEAKPVETMGAARFVAA
jgi:hypothetical protein